MSYFAFQFKFLWPTGVATSILATLSLIPWMPGNTSETIMAVLQGQLLQGTQGGWLHHQKGRFPNIQAVHGGDCMVQLHLGAASSSSVEQMGAAGERRGSFDALRFVRDL